VKGEIVDGVIVEDYGILIEAKGEMETPNRPPYSPLPYIPTFLLPKTKQSLKKASCLTTKNWIFLDFLPYFPTQSSRMLTLQPFKQF
jgi:hypothetical protein